MANKLVQAKDGADNVFFTPFFKPLLINDDLNNEYNVGIYMCGANSQIPQNSPTQAAFLMIVGLTDNYTVIQAVFDYQGRGYVRLGVKNGAFQPWKQI